MGGIPLLVALTCVMVDAGWQPDQSGTYRYIIQVSPEQLTELQKTGRITSEIPDELIGRISRVELRVGGDPPPQDPPLEQVVARYPSPPDTEPATVRGQDSGDFSMPPALSDAARNVGNALLGSTDSSTARSSDRRRGTNMVSNTGPSTRPSTGSSTTGSNTAEPRSLSSQPSSPQPLSTGTASPSTARPATRTDASNSPIAAPQGLLDTGVGFEMPAPATRDRGYTTTPAPTTRSDGYPAGTLPPSIAISSPEQLSAQAQLKIDEELLNEVGLRQQEDRYGNLQTVFFDRRTNQLLRADDPRYALMLDLLVRQGEITPAQAETLKNEADLLVQRQRLQDSERNPAGSGTYPPADPYPPTNPYPQAGSAPGGASAGYDPRYDSYPAGDRTAGGTYPPRDDYQRDPYPRPSYPADSYPSDRYPRYADRTGAGGNLGANDRLAGGATANPGSSYNPGNYPIQPPANQPNTNRPGWNNQPPPNQPPPNQPPTTSQVGYPGGAGYPASNTGYPGQQNPGASTPTLSPTIAPGQTGQTTTSPPSTVAQSPQSQNPATTPSDQVAAGQSPSDDTKASAKDPLKTIEPGPLLLGMLLLSLVINGYLAIAISRLLTRYRNVIATNRTSPLSA